MARSQKQSLIERPSNFAFSLKNVRSPAFLNRHFSLQIQKAGTPNKNTNKLIRQFLPKSARLDVIDDEQIQQVEDYLNNRPRKVLGFRTPFEVKSDFWCVAVGG